MRRSRILLIALRRLAGCKWRMPVPMPLSESERGPTSTGTHRNTIWRNLERVVRKVGHWTELDRFVPPHASEFGLFVQMTKR